MNPNSGEQRIASDDLSVEPDLHIIPSEEEAAELEIGSGLSLLFGRQYSEETYEELDVLRQNPHQPSLRERLAQWFGPEMTAGVVIGLLVAVFVVLMVAGVRNETSGPAEVNPPAAETVDTDSQPVAPPADEVTVELGEPVTIERE